MSLEALIGNLKTCWSEPKFPPVSDPNKKGFALACRFADAAYTAEQIHNFANWFPQELVNFWQITQWAELFKDEEYGQWGLHILSPLESLRETAEQRQDRGQEYKNRDLVIGRFFGDLEFLILRSDNKKSDFGDVLIALPIEGRSGWPKVALSFQEFLTQYSVAEGQKYWEIQRAGS